MTRLSDLGQPIPGTHHGREPASEADYIYRCPTAARKSTSAICASITSSWGTSRLRQRPRRQSSNFASAIEKPSATRTWPSNSITFAYQVGPDTITTPVTTDPRQSRYEASACRRSFRNARRPQLLSNLVPKSAASFRLRDRAKHVGSTSDASKSGDGSLCPGRADRRCLLCFERSLTVGRSIAVSGAQSLES